MAVKLKLSKKQQQLINKKFSKDGKIECRICGKKWGSSSGLDYHYIAPPLALASDGLDNIAVVCKSHKKDLKNLSILEYEGWKKMEEFFFTNKPRKLDDVLQQKIGKDTGLAVKVNINDSQEMLELDLDDCKYQIPVSVCPSTGYRYFYAVLPARYLHNDIELQPRPLEMKRLWELYQHLLVHSQLTPSVCRLKKNRILLFDGQHKTAAQIWAGRTDIECKVYLDPEVRVLKETNLIAHDRLRQMPFFSSVLINKWADLFTEEWHQYLGTSGEKSEAGFVSFLVQRGKKKPEATNMIASNIYDSILEDEQNRFTPYISDYGQPDRGVVSLGQLKQNLFKKFIARPPLKMDIEDSDELRELERENMVKLLNLIQEATIGQDQDKTSHIYSQGPMRAWSTLVRDTIAQLLGLYDQVERKTLLLRDISPEDWDIIEEKINRLFGHRVWSEENERGIASFSSSKEDEVIDYLRTRGLSVRWILSDTGTRVNINNFVD